VGSATVTKEAVTCAANATYTLGGTISGLTASGLVLASGTGATLTVSSGASSFTFVTALSAGTAYSMTVSTQPSGLGCSIANGSGTMPAANVTNVQVSCSAVVSQGGPWIWESGSYYQGNAGVYGTQGVAAAGNMPGARSHTVGWTDTSGNLWLFSGAGSDANGNAALLNDVWMYNIGSGQWTWEGGSQYINAFPNWGTQGVAAASNNPGARQMAASWRDSSGNLYLYAGSTLGYEPVVCNDLWYYNTQSLMWTWLNGPSVCNAGPNAIQSGSYTWETNSNQGNGLLPVFGTQGVAAAGNTPGARKEPATWIDNSGNLWLFGGFSYGVAGSTYAWLDDLWRYQPANGMWTYMGGSQSSNTNQGVYGTQGVGSTSNYPGTRQQSNSWTDTQGNLYLFGGQGPEYDSLPSYYNDLWKYTIASGQWTWLTGSNTYINSGSNGVYGTQGVAAAGNTPGARFKSATWIDSSGNLWLFGGSNGEGPTNVGDLINYSDLWMYNPSSNQWTWENGPTSTNQSANCGTKGVASSSNLPGPRDSVASWLDLNGQLWMFGGDGYDCTNNQNNLGDLWKY
jgi:N-acetylneuraminic acid mutarotase